MNSFLIMVFGLGLLFFLISFIGILCNVKSLFNIEAQNDTILSFLYNMAMIQWQETHARIRPAEDLEETGPAMEPVLRLHRQEEVYAASGPQLAGLK
jgi:histidyl-tRNA synthetase